MHIDDRRRAIYGANNRVEPVARGPHAAQIAPISSNPQIRKPSRGQAGETGQQTIGPNGKLWQKPVEVRRQHCDVGSDLLEPAVILLIGQHRIAALDRKRRVGGKACGSPCRSSWLSYYYKKKTN